MSPVAVGGTSRRKRRTLSLTRTGRAPMIWWILKSHRFARALPTRPHVWQRERRPQTLREGVKAPAIEDIEPDVRLQTIDKQSHWHCGCDIDCQDQHIQNETTRRFPEHRGAPECRYGLLLRVKRIHRPLCPCSQPRSLWAHCQMTQAAKFQHRS